MPQKKEEDYITNKVLAVFTVCLAGVLILMGISRLLNRGDTFLAGMTTVRVLMGISAVGILLGIILAVREKSSGKDNTYKILTGRSLIIVFAVSLVVLAFIHYYGFPVFKFFYALLPALAVYYLIYHSYQAEFCVISVDCGIAVLLLMLVRWIQVNGGARRVSCIVAAVCGALALVQIALALQIRKADGKLKLGSRKLSFVFSKNAYTMLIVTPVVMTALLVIGALMGTTVSLYAVFAVVSYLFVTAVYYTVKMM